MKTVKLVLGILAIVLAAFVMFQSCAAGVLDAMEDAGGISGASGTIVAIALCWTIIGLIVGLVIRKKGVEILAKNDADRRTINEYFGRKERENVELLGKALDARADANHIVESFQAREGSEEINLHSLEAIPPEPVEEPAPEEMAEEEPVAEEEAPVEEPVEETEE